MHFNLRRFGSFFVCDNLQKDLLLLRMHFFPQEK